MDNKYRIKAYPDGDLYLTLEMTAEEYDKFKSLSGDEQEKYIDDNGNLGAENVRSQIAYTTIRDLEKDKDLETEEWFDGW